MKDKCNSKYWSITCKGCKDCIEERPICADRDCKDLEHKHSWMR